MPDPFVACFCTIRFICDVSGVLPLAHKKLAFEKLQNKQREELSGFSPQDFYADDGHLSRVLAQRTPTRAVEGTDLIHTGY